MDNSGVWTDGNNWNPTNQPGASDEALFNNAGNSQTTINVGGSQSAGSVAFDTNNAAGYTVGGSSDTLTLSGTTAVSLTSTVTNAQAINSSLALSSAAVSISNASATTLTLGAIGTSATLQDTAATPTSMTLTVNNGGTITVNDIISGPVGSNTSGGGLIVASASGKSGTVVLNGQNTYSGITNINNGSGSVTIAIGSNSTLSGPTLVSGPFGTSTLTPNNSNQNPLEAFGGNRTVANPVNLISGVTIQNAAVAYSLTLTGPITFNPNASRTFTVNVPGQTLTLGSSVSPSTMTLAPTASFNLAFSTTASSNLVLNDTIQDNSSSVHNTISFNSINNNTAEGTVLITAQNTYSGGTTFNASAAGGPLTVEIDSSSNGAGTAGPFGSGAITFADGNAPPVMEAYGADRTIANALTFTNGMFAGAPPTGIDSTSPHNLTFTGATSFGKTITNNIPSGAALFFGASPSSSTLFTVVTGATIQSQSGAGITVLNDVLAGSGGMTFKSGGAVYVNNTGNTYSGTLNVIGTGTGVAGNGLGTGATLAGKGTAGTGSGNVIIGSTTSGSVGGIVSPGGDGTTLTGPGTLTVANMTWDPYGRYVFQFNATDNTAGNNINDLISGTGALNLSALSASAPFDINLQPLGTGADSPYTIATFTGGILGPGNVALANGTDVSSDFTFSGSFDPTVTVGNGGNSLILTIAAPEPASLSLLSFGALGLLRRRRKQM